MQSTKRFIPEQIKLKKKQSINHKRGKKAIFDKHH